VVAHLSSVRARRKDRSPKTTWPVGRLTVWVRDGYFHARGTVKHGGVKRRVRQALDIEYARKNVDAALSAAREVEAAVLAEIMGGVKPISCAEFILSFMSRPSDKALGQTDIATLQEIALKFGTRLLRDIAPAEFISFVDERQAGNAAATRERYLNTVAALLRAAIARGQYEKMPDFSRDAKARNPTTRAKRPVEKVGAHLVAAIFSRSHIANRVQYAVEETTGARVSSVLCHCALGDLDLRDNAMALTFHDTKNGMDVTAALPKTLRPLLNEYLTWRQIQVRAGRVGAGSSEPLFLTPKGVPYKDNKQAWGTQNKSAFNGAKRRAAKTVAQQYDDAIAAATAEGNAAEVEDLRRRRADDLSLLKRFTQHWFRHHMATQLGRKDPKAAMKQGGWKDMRSVSGYMIDDAEYQRQLVEQRGSAGTKLTRGDADD
jgi:hypothetical protein